MSASSMNNEAVSCAAERDSDEYSALNYTQRFSLSAKSAPMPKEQKSYFCCLILI